ncbi:MAG: Crp/Fnr family transcriptional regulator [Saprospiraceae bacterium]|nr:Crp/Fnr family transcriptional regulator [Saprospiraceae bacterium]
MEQFLKSLGFLTNHEIQEVLSLCYSKTIKKGTFLIQEGQYAKEVAFVQSGIFRSFYTTQAGEEVTYCFMFPDHFVSAYSSFISGDPSIENIQAITDVEMLLLSKADIERIAENSLHLTKVLRYLAEQQFIEQERRIFLLQREKAEFRYEDLMKKNPDYFLQIPLQYIASYLGITQRHLSRIRAKF